ncbi:hypothetical protein CDS [Salmonella enterica subsp. enterica serovar Derby]|nr:hypothetical protein CDS [Salmonella enterica subsp. enterica serovar Derby]
MALCILDVLDYFNLVKKRWFFDEKRKKFNYRKCIKHYGC